MIRGKYYSFTIGELLQGLKIFKQKDDTISVLQNNWFLISDSLQISKYSKGTLYLKTKESPLYFAHLSEEIKTKCNKIIGEDRIKQVKIIKAKF